MIFASVPVSRAGRQGALVAAVALIAAAPFFLGGYALHLAVSGGLMALSAMALTVLSGSAGLPSLGTAAFLAIGAFSAGMLSTRFGLGLLPAAAAAAGLGLVAGALVAILTLRVSGLYLAVGTLALQYLVHILAAELDLKFTYAAGFVLEDPVVLGLPISSPERWWALVLVVLALVHGLFRALQASHIGRAWVFQRTEPTAAGALGVAVSRSRVGVFALTSAVIAAAGALDGYRLGNVQASIYTLQLAVVYLTVAALGGAGNLKGAIAASYLVILLPGIIVATLEALSLDATSRVAGLENVVIGLILILALRRVPQKLTARLSRRRTRHVEG
ncbi:branched-chain amino acid ABC transporter permease [Xanthobacter sediminis]|uniref:branched-chain amino acid ABC transporter permease n=1 Tax=Xanthobacter sediminis TaxID=3119926 RepID=UPI00372B9215